MVQDATRVGGAPYRQVKELERTRCVPEDLDCSLSLLAYMRHKAAARGKSVPEPTPEPAAQGMMLGLRTDFTAIDDAVASLAQAYRAGEKLAPILALATVSPGGQWHPVGTAVGTIFRPFVIDGAIRAIAAIEAGVRQVEVAYIAPTHPDTPPELLFMYFNSRHGVRLTTVERDRVVRAMARRYRETPPEGHDGRDRHMFALWMGERCGLAASTIEEIVKGIFGVRTPEERQRAVQMMVVEGKSATEASRETGGSRQANKRLHDRAVRQMGRLGVGTGNGHRPATAEDIHVTTIADIDARTAAENLRDVLKHVFVDTGDLVSGAVVKVKPLLKKALRGCSSWCPDHGGHDIPPSYAPRSRGAGMVGRSVSAPRGIK